MTANADWRTIGPVLLRWGNGDEESHAGIEDAVARLGWPTVSDLVEVENFGFRDGDPFIGELIHRNEHWNRVALYDEHGLLIPAWRLLDVARALSLEKRWRNRVPRWRRQKNRHVFRRGPVSGTGRGRACYSNWLRAPATFQERSEAEFAVVDDDLLEHDVRVRARRNGTNLPTSYDDITRNDHRRSWKSTRRTQWKEGGR
jgi:hypothetical protein